MSKADFYRIAEEELRAASEYYDRRDYEYWFDEPYSHGVLRQFSRAMAVAAYAAAHFEPGVRL